MRAIIIIIIILIMYVLVNYVISITVIDQPTAKQNAFAGSSKGPYGSSRMMPGSSTRVYGRTRAWEGENEGRSIK